MRKKYQRPLKPKPLTEGERHRMERYLVQSGCQVPFDFAKDLLPPTPKPKRKQKQARTDYCD
jgi:hypothetical protein